MIYQTTRSATIGDIWPWKRGNEGGHSAALVQLSFRYFGVDFVNTDKKDADEKTCSAMARAIARIFSPANHRRITWSISILLTSRYAIFSPPPKEWMACLCASIERNRGWVNDPENVGESWRK
jgi:hypothetical protein